jgi:hypothetical protein
MSLAYPSDKDAHNQRGCPRSFARQKQHQITLELFMGVAPDLCQTVLDRFQFQRQVWLSLDNLIEVRFSFVHVLINSRFRRGSFIVGHRYYSFLLGNRNL